VKRKFPVAINPRGPAWPASPFLTDVALIGSQLLAMGLVAIWTLAVHGAMGWSAGGGIRAAAGVFAVGVLGKRAWARALHLVSLERLPTPIE
jgi:hypothetical protein